MCHETEGHNLYGTGEHSFFLFSRTDRTNYLPHIFLHDRCELSEVISHLSCVPCCTCDVNGALSLPFVRLFQQQKSKYDKMIIKRLDALRSVNSEGSYQGETKPELYSDLLQA